jgi:hypothetical protein
VIRCDRHNRGDRVEVDQEESGRKPRADWLGPGFWVVRVSSARLELGNPGKPIDEEIADYLGVREVDVPWWKGKGIARRRCGAEERSNRL